MRGAKTLTIIEIKWLALITKFNDVVGIHAVLGLCPAAPMAMVHCLTPTTSTGHYLGTPPSELGRVVQRVFLLRR